MSFTITAVAIAAIGTGYSIYAGERSASMQAEAQKQAKANALKQEKAADEANNRANQKTPDTNALLSSAQQLSKMGTAGTMLTGPQGIDPATLQLGKTSLLGG